MKFRLGTMAYAFALLAAGMATFGGWGIARTIGVLLFWGWTANGRPRHMPLAWGLGSLVIFGLFGWFLPIIPGARQRAVEMICFSRLKQISMGFQNYEAARGSYPSAVTRDAQGNSLHSWRMLVLPYMEDSALFQRIDLTRPWDSPANAQALGTGFTAYEYQCHAEKQGSSTTSYFAVVGPRTAWPPDRGRPLSEIADDRKTTIVLLEAPHRDIHWAEPSDLSFEEAVDALSGAAPELTGGHSRQSGFLYRPKRILNVAFSNGDVKSLTLPLSRELATALLTVDGGEKIDEAELHMGAAPELDYGRVWGLLAFVGLAIWPGVRLWRRAKKTPPV